MAGRQLGPSYAALDRLVARALDCEDRLTAWDLDFLSRFADRLDKYRDRTLISDREAEIIGRIAIAIGEG